MSNQLLSVASNVEWHPDSPHCPASVRSWLLDESSLTQKLERLYQKFTVDVIQQVHTHSDAEQLSGYFTYPEHVLVREVLLRGDGEAKVFAQTEIPSSTLTHSQQKLSNIGSASLGHILFQDKTAIRGVIEIARFPINSSIHHLCESLQQACKHDLWARRSIFFIKKKPLLVTEVFLPASGIYK